jgi:hypothetical protein
MESMFFSPANYSHTIQRPNQLALNRIDCHIENLSEPEKELLKTRAKGLLVLIDWLSEIAPSHRIVLLLSNVGVADINEAGYQALLSKDQDVATVLERSIWFSAHYSISTEIADTLEKIFSCPWNSSDHQLEQELIRFKEHLKHLKNLGVNLS